MLRLQRSARLAMSMGGRRRGPDGDRPPLTRAEEVGLQFLGLLYPRPRRSIDERILAEHPFWDLPAEVEATPEPAKGARRVETVAGTLCDQSMVGGAEMSSKIVRLRQAKIVRNATSRSKGRRGNDAYRVREHLTEAEMGKLLAALKDNRHGHRDWLIGLVIYRHGLRVSEACDLRWDDIDLRKCTIIVRRLKGSTDSVHYLERDEVNGLKLLQRQQREGEERGGGRGARISVPICAKVEHWCHSPSDPDWCQNSVNVGTFRSLGHQPIQRESDWDRFR